MENSTTERTLVNREPAYNNHFARVPIGLIKDNKVSPLAFRLYCLLISYAWELIDCFPGQTRLKHELGLSSDKKVRDLLQELRTANLISWQRRGLGKTNVYFIEKLPERYQLTGLNGGTLEEARRSGTARKQANRAEELYSGSIDPENLHNCQNANAFRPVSGKHLNALEPNQEGIPSSRLKAAATASPDEIPNGEDDNDPQERAWSKRLAKTDNAEMIQYFFDRYEQIFGEPHPRLKQAQLLKVDYVFTEREMNTDLIDAYFEMEFAADIDYRINHFISEGVISNLYYDVRY